MNQDSGLDPQAPSQPNLNQVYDTQDNPASQDPVEKSNAASYNQDAQPIDHRRPHDVPQSHNAEPGKSALGYGETGPLTEKQGIEPSNDQDGEQMRAPGEGDIAAKQDHKGGFGSEGDLASDLDRKKAEQAPLREEVKADREKKVDIGGALGQRGGVATVEGR